MTELEKYPVSELSDAALIELNYQIAEEMEARIMARAGETAGAATEAELPF